MTHPVVALTALVAVGLTVLATAGGPPAVASLAGRARELAVALARSALRRAGAAGWAPGRSGR